MEDGKEDLKLLEIKINESENAAKIIVVGIGGAFGGDALGKWIVDITCEEDWTWG